jgi:hypothetical protein
MGLCSTNSLAQSLSKNSLSEDSLKSANQIINPQIRNLGVNFGYSSYQFPQLGIAVKGTFIQFKKTIYIGFDGGFNLLHEFNPKRPICTYCTNYQTTVYNPHGGLNLSLELTPKSLFSIETGWSYIYQVKTEFDPPSDTDYIAPDMHFSNHEAYFGVRVQQLIIGSISLGAFYTWYKSIYKHSYPRHIIGIGLSYSFAD